MRFYQFICRNVLRRKFRSLLTGIGVAVAIMAVVGLLGVSNGFEKSSREMLASRGVDLVVVRAGLGERSTSRLDESIGQVILQSPEVAEVAPLLQEMVKLDDDPIGTPLQGYAPGSFALNNLKVDDKSGRSLTAKDVDGVILGKFLAQSLGKKPGDTLEIELKPFKVLGIFNGPSLFENRAAVALLPVLQELLDRQHQVSEFDVKLKSEFAGNDAALASLRAKIAALADPQGNSYHLEPLTTDQYISSSNELRLSQAMAWTTSVIALAIGAVGMLNTMIMSVLERTQEIGILRAIGWRRRRIMRMILGESFLLSVAGAVVGTLGAIGVTTLLSTLPAAEGLVRPDVSLSVILTGFVLALVVGLIGGAYPAIRGAGLAPTEALRYE
jgi:putative ABC transport system permease protein